MTNNQIVLVAGLTLAVLLSYKVVDEYMTDRRLAQFSIALTSPAKLTEENVDQYIAQQKRRLGLQ